MLKDHRLYHPKLKKSTWNCKLEMNNISIFVERDLQYKSPIKYTIRR